MGIIVSVDVENECVTFASHGDMLFKVDDSSKYNIGDTILFDGTVIDEDTPISLKVQRSTVGVVSGKIDEHTLAVFRA